MNKAAMWKALMILGVTALGCSAATVTACYTANRVSDSKFHSIRLLTNALTGMETAKLDIKNKADKETK